MNIIPKSVKHNLFVIFVFFACAIIFFALAYLVTTTIKNSFDQSKLDEQGQKTVANIELPSNKKNVNKITYIYFIDNKKYISITKFLEDKDENLHDSDKVWILYLPDKPAISKILRDENGFVLKRDVIF